MGKLRTAMLFAAGLGTRLKPITNDIPKALVPVNGITLLERNIHYLKDYGVEHIVVNVHHFSDKIIAFLQAKENFGLDISISDESDAVLETGGGLKKAQVYLEGETFILMNVDILTNLDLDAMVQFHQEGGQIATLGVNDRKSSRKLLFDQANCLMGWLNIDSGQTRPPDLDVSSLRPFAFSGIHVLSTEIFDLLPNEEKYSIIDPYITNCPSGNIRGFVHDALVIDVGKHDSLKEAEAYFK